MKYKIISFIYRVIIGLSLGAIFLKILYPTFELNAYNIVILLLINISVTSFWMFVQSKIER